jgi:hypothetical protein
MSSGSNSFAGATEVVIASDGDTYTSDPTDNSTFTMETGEPMPTVYTSGKSMWWKYTPASSGTATFDLSGTTNGPGGTDDTEMAVYTGSVLTSLTKVASDSDSGTGNTSKVTGLSVTGGTTYYVQAATYNAFAISGVTLAVTGPATGSSGLTGTLTGTLPTLTGTFDGASAPSGSLVGTLPALTGSFAGTATSGDGSVSGVLVGTLPALTSSFDGTGYDVDESHDYAPALPDPTPPPLSTSRVLVSVATSLPFPTLVDGRPQ